MLTQADIHQLHAAILSAGLIGEREALLGGIDAGYAAGLAHAGAPGPQVLQDLNAMNTTGTLRDGSRPLARWLANAVHMSASRQESVVFQAALAKVELAAAPAPPKHVAGPGAPRPASVRKLVAQVLRADSDLDAFCLDHFRSVYDRFSAGMDRVRKMNLLLEQTTPAEIVARLREHDPRAVQQHEHLLELG